MRRPWASALAACAALFLCSAAPAAAAAQPFWLRQDYTDWAGIDPTQTTAAVDTSGSGTVRLPYLPMELSFDPRGSYALVATAAGVPAYVFDGQDIRPVAGWQLDSLGATGASWIGGGAAFVVATTAQLALYGLEAGSGRAVRTAQVSARGITDLAAGPSGLPFSVLAATAGGATLYAQGSGGFGAMSGGPGGLLGNRGVATAPGGGLAATWQGDAIQLWAWDGVAYHRAPAWDPPAPGPAAGAVRGVAFFPDGGGYWVLTTDGQLHAYAYGAGGLRALAGLSVSLPDQPVGVATGWSGLGAGVLYPQGWRYLDVSAADTFIQDPSRGLSGQAWQAYAATATLTSTPEGAGHSVVAVRLEDADCPAGQQPPACRDGVILPPGTTIAYALSTDGCTTWHAAAPYTTVALDPGDSLCYRITLRTTVALRTPVIDVTLLYEIAPRVQPGPLAALLCTGVSCAGT